MTGFVKGKIDGLLSASDLPVADVRRPEPSVSEAPVIRGPHIEPDDASGETAPGETTRKRK